MHPLKRTFLLVLIAAIPFSLFAAPIATPLPNIVFILADDLGYGSVGCYGAKGVNTPNIDRLATQGRLFRNAYAPGSVCSPTRYGLMTGRYYWRTSVKDGKVLPINAPLHIETNRMTLASLCKSQGYRTAAFGKWHLGMTTDKVTDWTKPLVPGPQQVGFDYFFGMPANLGNGPKSFVQNAELVDLKGAADQKTESDANWPLDAVMPALTRRVTGWLETNSSRPFFVYFAPNAIHEPIVPESRFAKNPYGKYGDFIDELDWSVGQLLAALGRLKLSENTMVIFSSDNGGVVNAGNPNASAAIKAGLAINGPLRGGKHSEWEGGFREPFILRWPNHVPAGTTSDQVICLTDMLATFGELFGVKIPEHNGEDSFTVLRALTEKEPGAPVREQLVLQAADATYDIRMGDWKLVERADPPSFESVRNKRKTEQAANKRRQTAKRADELYNLKADPTETNNVAAANPDRVKALKQALVAARDRGETRGN
jgi:arylsulfatase A